MCMISVCVCVCLSLHQSLYVCRVLYACRSAGCMFVLSGVCVCVGVCLMYICVCLMCACVFVGSQRVTEPEFDDTAPVVCKGGWGSPHRPPAFKTGYFWWQMHFKPKYTFID